MYQNWQLIQSIVLQKVASTLLGIPDVNAHLLYINIKFTEYITK